MTDSDKFTQPSTAKLYLERLQVDFLHRQSAVFCEKLRMREITVRSVEELLVGIFCAAVSCKNKTKQKITENKVTNLQMLQVVLLDVLGEIVHLKVKDNSSKTVRVSLKPDLIYPSLLSLIREEKERKQDEIQGR